MDRTLHKLHMERIGQKGRGARGKSIGIEYTKLHRMVWSGCYYYSWNLKLKLPNDIEVAKTAQKRTKHYQANEFNAGS